MISQLKWVFQNLKWNPFAFASELVTLQYPEVTQVGQYPTDTSWVFLWNLKCVWGTQGNWCEFQSCFYSSGILFLFCNKGLFFNVYKEFRNQGFLGRAGATDVGSFPSFTVVLKSTLSSFLQRVICTRLWIQTREFIEYCRGSDVMKHLWGLGGQRRHEISNSRLVTSKSPGTILKYRFLGLRARVI